MNAQRYAVLVCAVLLSVSNGLHAQSSAADLSCWGRNGKFQSRRATTPISKSSVGFAYGEVIAKATSGAENSQTCKNAVRLLYSTNGKNYKVVYERQGGDLEGIGVRLVGWSLGKQLLIELTEWGYDSDADISKSVLVFDRGSPKIKEIPMGEAFQRFFRTKQTECEFDSHLVAWRTDNTVTVRISQSPPTEHYQQVFCVTKPSMFIFDPHTGNVKPTSSR